MAEGSVGSVCVECVCVSERTDVKCLLSLRVMQKTREAGRLARQRSVGVKKKHSY